MMSESKLLYNFYFTNDRWILTNISIGNYGISPKIKYGQIFLCTAKYDFNIILKYYLSTIPQPFSSSEL